MAESRFRPVVGTASTTGAEPVLVAVGVELADADAVGDALALLVLPPAVTGRAVERTLWWVRRTDRFGVMVLFGATPQVPPLVLPDARLIGEVFERPSAWALEVSLGRSSAAPETAPSTATAQAASLTDRDLRNDGASSSRSSS